MSSGWSAGHVLIALLFVVIVAGIVAVIIWTLRIGPIRPQDAGAADETEDALARQLADGEISPDEYRTRIDALRGTRPPAP